LIAETLGSGPGWRRCWGSRTIDKIKELKESYNASSCDGRENFTRPSAIRPTCGYVIVHGKIHAFEG